MGHPESTYSSDEKTRQLARFCVELNWKELSDEEIQASKTVFADFLGACYAGTKTDPGELIREYANVYSAPEATIIGGETGSLAPFAALANGTAAHALDVDDGHRGASAHLGSAVIPAALATAEKQEKSGRELIEAIVVGYDVMAKIAVSVQTSHRERHFHATATCGCFGAAAAVSRLLDLDTDQTAHALGLAGTQAGGLFEFLEKGSMAKRFHPGRASLAGIVSGDLAAIGFDGPDTIIEGDEGFVRAYADEFDFSPLDKLGDPFEVTQVYIKPDPICRHIHGPVEAIKEIRSRGVSASDVEHIRVETYQSASYHDNKQIENLLDTQMSIPFTLAVALVTGKSDLEQFDPAVADNPEIANLIESVEVVATEEMESAYPETRPVRVIVQTEDGTQYENLVEYPYGAPENPLSEANLRDKFKNLSKPVLDDNEQTAILDGVFKLDEWDDVTSLTELL